ncbi:MAG: hypothetical protein ACLRVN_01945 [Butyricicoccus sp.]
MADRHRRSGGDRGLTAPALFALIDMVNAFDDAFTAANVQKCCGFQRFGALCRASLYRRKAVTWRNHAAFLKLR